MEANMARMNADVQTQINGDGSVTVTFAGFDPVTVHSADMPDNVRLLCAAYGLREKITNATALPRDPKTGRSATVAEKREAAFRVIEAMMAGQWEIRAASGTGDDAVLIDAVAELTGQPRATIAELAKAWTATEKRDLIADADVAPIFARLKVEAARRVAGGSDAKAILAGIGKKA